MAREATCSPWHVADLHGNKIAPAQSAVVAEVEEGKLADPAFHLEPNAQRSDVFQLEWCFLPNDLALVPRSWSIASLEVSMMVSHRVERLVGCACGSGRCGLLPLASRVGGLHTSVPARRRSRPGADVCGRLLPGVPGSHAGRTSYRRSTDSLPVFLEVAQHDLRTSAAALICAPYCACYTPLACGCPATPLRE